MELAFPASNANFTPQQKTFPLSKEVERYLLGKVSSNRENLQWMVETREVLFFSALEQCVDVFTAKF